MNMCGTLANVSKTLHASALLLTLLIVSGCGARFNQPIKTSNQALLATNSNEIFLSKFPSLLMWLSGEYVTGTDAQNAAKSSQTIGSLSSSVTLGDGRQAKAFLLNGIDSSIQIPYSSNFNLTDAITVSAWINSTLDARSSASLQTILSKWDLNHDGINNPYHWKGVDISGSTILNNSSFRGFKGGIFDGRYIYFAGSDQGSAISSIARYDTHGDIHSASSWTGIDLSSSQFFNNSNYQGYVGGIFDGRYVYFLPRGTPSATKGFLARYDTQKEFTSGSAWEGIDMTSSQALGNANYKGYAGAAFDGRYIYFSPRTNGSASGYVARFDTQGKLNEPSSWLGLDIRAASILNNSNYHSFIGATYDGRYVYFIAGNSGYFARYDTKNDFLSGSSWQGVEISGSAILNDTNYRAFSYGTFDGRYIYFSKNNSSRIARYDTQGSFTSSSGWTGIDVAGSNALNNSAFNGSAGAIYDGRYIYLIPSGKVLARYDTQGAINSKNSWTGVDLTGTSAFNDSTYAGYNGGVYDGRYLYLVPYRIPSGAFSGKVARYDTLSEASFALKLGEHSGDGTGMSAPGPSFIVNTLDGPMTVQSQKTLTQNEWHHIAATFDGEKLSLYLDGSLVATRSSDVSRKIASTTSNLSLGSLSSGNGFFNGAIEDVMLFNSALSADDIKTLYDFKKYFPAE